MTTRMPGLGVPSEADWMAHKLEGAMSDTSLNIVIGGEAGQGLVTVGDLLTKTLVRSGYEVLVTQSYESRIRGGHNTFAVRFGPEPVLGPSETIDVLVALDQETVDRHGSELSSRGVVILDQAMDPKGFKAFSVPFDQLALKPIFMNTAALGVLASTVCSDISILEELLRQTFARKGETIVAQNVDVLQRAMAWQKDQPVAFECPGPSLGGKGRLTLNGNEAMALGALAAGCNFCSFYPMTPSTSIALTLANKGALLGLVAEQAEDEIAALNMALGASYAGARAVVPTSGGGFSLMTEAVSLAGMIETPVVILLAQRPGPATGLPTRTEQGDLNLVLHAGHGEFPRAILAPGTVEECFYLTHRAFDLAEQHQTPVFVLTDQFLADSFRAVDPFDLNHLPPMTTPLLVVEHPDQYHRYALTKNGISPRVVPGFSETLVVVDSDEHTPDGHLTEDLSVRTAMVEKRQMKECGLFSQIIPPEFLGDDEPDVLFVSWGSTRGPALEAAQILSEQGRRVGLLHFSQVWPLHSGQFIDRLKLAKIVIGVEGNTTGQFVGLIHRASGFRIERLLLRYDGLPFTARYILKRFQAMKV